MIKIFTGGDRVKITEAVKAELGERYEVFEGAELGLGDLTGIFQGATLFSEAKERRVLIRDLGENKELFGEFSERAEEFLETEAKVILFETKFDKRLAVVKRIGQAGIEVREFKAEVSGDGKAIFEVYNVALRDGVKAVRELEKIQAEQDPYMFFGLMVTQALKKLEWRPKGVKEKRVVKALAKADMEMKTTAVEPWLIVKSFLVRLSSM